MIADYKANIEYLVNVLNFQEYEIFDFSDKVGEDEFESNYQFCQGALFLHREFGIEPCYFYYRDFSDLDAKAIKTQNHYLIGINRGIVESYYRDLVTYFKLQDYDEVHKYIELEEKLANPVGELMYQSILHFTFYHELGHLIQFSGKENGDICESLNDGLDYSIDLHSEELDADLFASISVSTHFYQYLKKQLNKELSANDVTNYISILTSSIFIYFLSFAEYRNGFYLKEKSHPHPILRIISATARIIGYFEHVSKKNNLILNIDQQLVLKETFRLSEIFINKSFAKKEFQGFLGILNDNLKYIMLYYSELIEIIQNNPNSAINRRNEKLNNK